MASVVEICNLALSHIGKGVPISALSEASEEARQCNLHYTHARDVLLSQFDYMFARKVQSLAELANDWDERWEYRYQKPSDCLRVIRIVPEVDAPEDEHDPVAFGLRNGSIYTDLSPSYLEYTFRQTDPSRFAPHFVDALSWSLAARIAFPLTRDRQVRADAAQMAGQLRLTAETSDANDAINSYSVPASHIEARN